MKVLALATILTTGVTLIIWAIFINSKTVLRTKRILKPFNILLHFASLILNGFWISEGGEHFFFLVLLATGVLGYLNYRTERLNGVWADPTKS